MPYPPAVVAKAFCLYMDTSKTFKEISAELDVPIVTLNAWRTRKDWVAKKKAFLEDLQTNTDLERRNVVMNNVVPVIKRHLTVSGALEDATLEVIKNSTKKNEEGEDVTTLTPRDISDLGKGLNQSTAVSARVVGIDKSSAVEQVGMNNISAGAGSLIQVGLLPLPAQKPEPIEPQPYEQGCTIDVEPDIQECKTEPLTDFPDAEA